VTIPTKVSPEPKYFVAVVVPATVKVSVIILVPIPTLPEEGLYTNFSDETYSRFVVPLVCSKNDG
jgi:hypothetical protein